MKKHSIEKAKGSFAVLHTDGRSQAAMMRLAPGGSSGEKGNEHPQSDQVLLVVRAPHRFGNGSEEEALTFNVYTPPEY